MRLHRNLASCQIKYCEITVRADDFRTRNENLSLAWKLLKLELGARGWAIPASLRAFQLGGGSVTYYTSF